jgi:hypothetical protein
MGTLFGRKKIINEQLNSLDSTITNIEEYEKNKTS